MNDAISEDPQTLNEGARAMRIVLVRSDHKAFPVIGVSLIHRNSLEIVRLAR